MKKLSLLVSLMLGITALTWAGSAVVEAYQKDAPGTAAAETETSGGFTPGTAVVAEDELLESMAYVLRSERGYLLYSTSFTDKLCASSGGSVQDKGTAAYDVVAQQFQFKTVEGRRYLYSLGAGKYVKSDGTFESEPTSAVTLLPTGDASRPWQIKVGSNYVNINTGVANGCVVDTWSTLDAGNRIEILEAAAQDEAAALRGTYSRLVKEIEGAGAFEFFHLDNTEALASIPAATPADADGLTAAIEAMTAAIAKMKEGDIVDTDIDGKALFIGNKLHATRFVNVYQGSALGCGEGKYAADYVWTFEKAEGEDTYYIKSEATGLYVAPLPDANNQRVSLVEKDAAGLYAVEYTGENGYVNIYSKTGTANLEALHMVDWDGVVRWSKTADASKFTLQSAESLLPALEKYYIIKNKKQGYVSVDDAYIDANGNLKLTNDTKPKGMNGLWHIIREKDGAIRFVNAGEAKKGLVMSTTGSEDGARTCMVAPANAKDDALFRTSDGELHTDGATANYIRLASSASNYWNKRGDYLALWNTTSAIGDEGSTFLIEEVTPTEELLYAEFHTVTPGTRPADINDFSLWYNVPVAHTTAGDTWMEYALPLGNGQVGATIRGGLFQDEIQFNEKTLWAGSGANSNQGYYQNFGSIMVVDKSGSFSCADDTKPAKEYVRYLDIIDGVAGVNYKSSDEQTGYKRRYFVSSTDRALVARYEADGTDKLTLNFTYRPDNLINAGAVTYADATAAFGGKLDVVTYNTRFKVVADEGATITTSAEDGILVQNARWVNLVMAAATDYDATKSGCVSGETAQQIAQKVSDRVDAAAAQPFETLLASHTAKHSGLMNRTTFTIGEKSDKTTEDLIKFYNASAANKTTPEGLFLESLYFQYGRYFTIGANLDTEIHAPSNLQGIWNDRSNTPFWHCDIHADINVQMNYWPADPTNLSEFHRPFLDHIIDMASAPDSPWAALATKNAGKAGGWAVAVENNIFGGSSTWYNGGIKTCGAWYVSHLWRYYQYTLDREFLKKALPVMYDYCLYTKNISTKDSNGLWEIKNEWSPEHGPTDVTAFAQQTSYEALDEVFKAHAELGDESPLTEEQLALIQDLYDNFDKGIWIETSDSKQMISEWKNNALTDQGHRHLSHLMCLYPFSQVSAFDKTAEGIRRFRAAYNGMIARNGDVTGWSMGWQTNTYARCLDGDRARKNLTLALRHSTDYTIAMGGQGGCYYNLFDAHSPFQIDGNYGCTSGIAEMLVQGYDGVVTLLPALPTAWKSGSVTGLKAQGNYLVDITWADGAATEARITNNLDEKRLVRVRLGKTVDAYEIEANGTLTLDLTNGLPTAIAAPDAPFRETGKATYDLSGRRVKKAGKGVYIVDGHKVIR